MNVHNTNAIALDTRCTFLYRDGRRCRMLRSSDPELCPYHLQQRLKLNHAESPKPQPFVAPGALDNPWAVRRALRHIIRELAEGRLTPDSAQALASLTRLLLIRTRRPRKRRRGSPAPAVRAALPRPGGRLTKP
ncbi:MAG: hypothetical protein ACRD5G_04585 [Candidatus Acidiferrales bacterium]